MRKAETIMILFALLVCVSQPVSAGENPVETVLEGCEQELTTYCSQVTPGQGRGLACLYAYSDKLSGKCEYALYDAAVQLERAVAALTYVASECMGDLKQFCSRVPAGEGRLLKCIEDHYAEVSDRCKSAVEDVGLKQVERE